MTISWNTVNISVRITNYLPKGSREEQLFSTFLFDCLIVEPIWKVLFTVDRSMMIVNKKTSVTIFWKNASYMENDLFMVKALKWNLQLYSIKKTRHSLHFILFIVSFKVNRKNISKRKTLAKIELLSFILTDRCSVYRKEKNEMFSGDIWWWEHRERPHSSIMRQNPWFPWRTKERNFFMISMF